MALGLSKEEPQTITESRSSRGLLLRFGLGYWLLMGALLTPFARAESEGSAEGLLELQITSPMSLPPGFTLNPGGTIPSNFLFPDAGNSGAGSLTALGSASCTPTGCTDPDAGLDLEYQLSNDLTCASTPDGTYGGLEDSFAAFGASNSTGGSVTLGLRFTTSWSVSATAVDPPHDSADAGIDLLWAVPTDFCIQLTSCPTGSLSGGTTAGCPAGFTTGTTLILGTSSVDTSMGAASDIGPVSICDATVVVLDGTNSGGALAVTSSCQAMGCSVLTLSDDTVDGELTEGSCRIVVGPNYHVSGPNGNLTLRAERSIEIGNGFSVGIDGELTLEIDSGP